VSAGAPYTLGHLAAAIGATLEGDAGQTVRGVAPLETAGPDDVSFLTGGRYRRQADESRAGAIVAGPDVEGLACAVLRVASPETALITLLRLFHPEPDVPPGIHSLAFVAEGATVDASASVGPFAVIEAGARIGARTRVGALTFVGAGAIVGEDSTLHPGVTVWGRVRIGRRVIVHPGAVLGADGFGYMFDGAGHRKIPQVGGVEIEDDVEIGANTTVDRGTMGDTVIGHGSKLDNLVQVGHNCRVGADVILVAQVGISGSCRIGPRAMLGGQVGLADHGTVGEGAMVAAQSGIPSDVPAGGLWGGSPVRPMSEMRRIWAAEGMLPDLVRKVRALEKRVRELEEGRPA
jgi:UDP-3-O-[3-hydroxymyristoyl] glucosamine N-acyltransferase